MLLKSPWGCTQKRKLWTSNTLRLSQSNHRRKSKDRRNWNGLRCLSMTLSRLKNWQNSKSTSRRTNWNFSRRRWKNSKALPSMGRFDNYRFHCSSLGKIMTDPRSGTGLSETCKAHLMECWIAETYGREKVFENKYMTKGTEVEENAITLYSRAKKKFFKKNTGVLSNEFIIGTPDTYDVADVIDIKSSWDIFTFFANIFKPLNKDYAWQLSGYRTLLKKLRALLVY